MRAAAAATVLAIAAATMLVGSCYWAWATDDFWRPVPLYPSVIAAGGLATLAVYAHSARALRAICLGAGVATITVASTAFITLIRWEL